MDDEIEAKFFETGNLQKKKVRLEIRVEFFFIVVTFCAFCQ